MHFGVSDHQHIGAVGRKKGWRRYKEPLEILNELYWTWMKEYPYHYSDKFPTVLQQERLPEVCLWWGEDIKFLANTTYYIRRGLCWWFGLF